MVAMRLFPPLLLLVLTLVDSSYYNAKTCGLSLGVRAKRSIDESSGESSGEDDYEDDDEDQMTKAPEFEMETDEPDESIKDTLTEKAMGGMNAKPGELPWAVRITRANGLCGGTLISKRHIITAAHCFVKGAIEGTCSLGQMMSNEEIIRDTRLTIGASCIPEEGVYCPKESLGVNATIKQVEFKTPFFLDKCKASHWDVVLLELNEVIEIPHACLPWLHGVDFLNVRKTEMLSFGFGNDPTKGVRVNPNLQKVNLETAHDPKVCKEAHNFNYDWLLCTRETYTKNVCAGDSGGGILAEHTIARRENGREIREEKKRHFLLGIISFGSSCTSSLENSIIADAQINMDINLYSATINKYLQRQVPDWRLKWIDNKLN